MNPKAIEQLVEEADPRLFRTLAEGMRLIAEHAGRLERSAGLLEDAGDDVGPGIMCAIAEEEAAKYLILLDAARCPRKLLKDQLPRFSSHLAKGSYARACWWRPSDLADLQRYVDMERDSFYLDGPNDVDWIFRNEIEREREDCLYVNLVEVDGERIWMSPQRGASPCGLRDSLALRLVQAMKRLGVLRSAFSSRDPSALEAG